jgi:hypothetical protein
LFIFLTALTFLIPTINMIVSYYLTRGTHINVEYTALHRVGYVVIALPYEVFKSGKFTSKLVQHRSGFDITLTKSS